MGGKAQEVTFTEKRVSDVGKGSSWIHVRAWHIVGAQEMGVLASFMNEAWHFHTWSYQLSKGKQDGGGLTPLGCSRQGGCCVAVS